MERRECISVLFKNSCGFWWIFFGVPTGKMAVSEKRLFWIAIIVVELVALYIVWRPYRDRFMRPGHKIAVAAPAARPPQPTTPAMPTPELKPPAVIIASHRPWAGVRHNPK